ncbi:AMP-binding protein [Helicobacter cinaedi]|nr:AMP-binding protein [Helicobacter cinaedi]
MSCYGDKNALILNDTPYTYAELCKKMSAFSLSQTMLTIPNNAVIALRGDYSLSYIIAFLALCKKQCIIAPLLPRNIDISLQDFGVEFVLDTQENKLDSISPKSHSLLDSLKKQNNGGLILFSSGSTGKPKAIVHNLNTLLESYCNKRQNPLRIMSLYLPDHIAGIDVMLNTFGGGGSLIIPKERSPQWILESLQKHKVEILPTSPTLLRLLLVAGLGNYDLTHLKLVIYGSEKMSSKLLESLQQALPHTRFKQSFGTSETNAIKTKQTDESDFAEFFRIINAGYKIVDNILYLKSHTNALGYLNSDNSVFDNEGYFATGDLVEVKTINGEEYIKIIGRAKEVINVGGEKVIPQEVEGVLLQIPFISDCVVYGESNAITGQSVSVKVVLDSNHYIKSSKAESANLDSKNTDSNTAEVSLSDFSGFQSKGEGSYLRGNDRALSAESAKSTKETTQVTQNLELKKYIRTFCKDKLAPFKIPSKVIVVESLEVSERLKRKRG